MEEVHSSEDGLTLPLLVKSIRSKLLDGSARAEFNRKIARLAVNLDGGTLVLENAFPYKGQRLLQERAQDKLETESVIQVGPKDHFASEMDHMADCVLKGEIPRTPGEEGLRDMKLMEAIYRAAEGRVSVKV